MIVNNTMYSNGFKWCSDCAKFIKTGKIFCPNCSNRLRAGPKSSRLKLDKPRIG